METSLLFTKNHEWVLDNADGTVTVGISEQAQSLLGDVVFIDLPAIGEKTESGKSFSLLESVKAASDIYAPVSGEIIAINEVLEDTPELINEAPYEGGWIAKINLSDPCELDALMSFDEYKKTY
ncbi:MAG: glycine cleavage system protein GcvH [Psychromonas sp.]|nr:glycine cleavage system protein GcvH [Psychromonas sp.]